MKTQNISIRIEPEVVIRLEAYAKAKEWSRNYLIGKILKEKIHELSGDCG